MAIQPTNNPNLSRMGAQPSKPMQPVKQPPVFRNGIASVGDISGKLGDTFRGNAYYRGGVTDPNRVKAFQQVGKSLFGADPRKQIREGDLRSNIHKLQYELSQKQDPYAKEALSVIEKDLKTKGIL